MKRIICLIVILVMMFTVNVCATDTLGDIINGANSFVSQPTGVDEATVSQPTGIDETKLADLIKSLTNIGLAIGTIVAVVVGVIIAIKFMTDGAQGRADLKTALTPYVIGVAILFGAYGIWVIVINVFTSVFSS